VNRKRGIGRRDKGKMRSAKDHPPVLGSMPSGLIDDPISRSFWEWGQQRGGREKKKTVSLI